MKKKKTLCVWRVLLCMALLLCVSVSCFAASAAEQSSSRTIRVGFPIQRGLTMRDPDGTLSGYTYDYLMEISQYTGWTYEFVFLEGSLNDQIVGLMELLAKGEIDLLGTMYYDETLIERFAYPGYCYGINYGGLFVDANSRLRESALYDAGQITVGVYHKDGRENPKLTQMAEMNGLNIQQVITTSADELERMLKEGEVDAVYSTDLAMANREDRYPVLHFSPQPFYFATTKGNVDIVRQLDKALSSIQRVNPDFMVELHEQYFLHQEEGVSWTSEEERYLAERGPLEVLLYDNKPPFQYRDEKTGELRGVTVDILNLLSETTGLQLHYNTVSSYEEYRRFLDEEQVDIAADAINQYQDALDLNSTLTLPWLSVPLSLVFPEDAMLREEGRGAIPQNLKNAIPKTDRVDYYDTAERCLEAVLAGTAAYACMDEYSAQYLFGTQQYPNLQRLHEMDPANQNLCFAVCNSEDLTLLSILNKGISALSEDRVSALLYENTYQQQEVTLWAVLKAHREMTMVCLMTLLLLGSVFVFHRQTRKQQRITFEHERNQALSNLANEYFYEYDIKRDLLFLSEKCAEHFGTQGVIPRFSRTWMQRKPEERIGIWEFSDHIVGAREGSCEMSCQLPDNSRQWYRLVSSILPDRKGGLYAVGKIVNIQEQKSEQIRLEQMASLDGLTGIYNAASMHRLVRERQEAPDGAQGCALLILDIDNFKQVNDRYGHYNGDATLVQLASLMSLTFPTALVGRLGGDEFLALVEPCGKAELEAQCRMLCQAMQQKTELLLGKAFSCSIGIAYVKPGISYDELYQNADAALYETKITHKNGYTFFGDRLSKGSTGVS